jgi:putative hydrolase of the HAD superfamily
MLDKSAIHGMLFDYGATIDSNGLHWAEVLWQGYQAAGAPVSRDAFRVAYVHGERHLATHRVIKPNHTFHDVLLAKTGIELDWLRDEGYFPNSFPLKPFSEAITDYCYRFACETTGRARPLLKTLGKRYPLVLVSNFYGNIETVLEEFALSSMFKSIVESSVVGVRKPDPAIFSIGVERLGLKPQQTVVVGDSWPKDIKPAASIGCQTVWLRGRGWDIPPEEATADLVIDDFSELHTLLENER